MRLGQSANRRRRGILLGILLVLCALMACAATYAVVARWIKSEGRTLTPSRDFPIREIAHYRQNDPLWAADRIGDSGYTLGGAGCLVSCVASSLSELGAPITPQELNDKLTAMDGYDDALLLWYKIHEAIPGADYRYSRIFSHRTLEKDLREGRLPIINVRYHGSGITHWLLVVGARDGEFWVSDPLSPDGEPIPLSVHGRVYAYRVLIPA